MSECLRAFGRLRREREREERLRRYVLEEPNHDAMRERAFQAGRRMAMERERRIIEAVVGRAALPDGRGMLTRRREVK